MAKWFAASGHTVLGCGRSANKVEKLKSLCKTARFSVVDVMHDTDVKKWAQESIAEFGAPTFLLNNAGITPDNANLWEVPQEEFDRVVDVNIKGTANMIRHFVPAMVKAKRGVVVNFSSGWGRSVAAQVSVKLVLQAIRWTALTKDPRHSERLPSIFFSRRSIAAQFAGWVEEGTSIWYPNEHVIGLPQGSARQVPCAQLTTTTDSVAERSGVVDQNLQWSTRTRRLWVRLQRPAVVGRFSSGGNSSGFSLPNLSTFYGHSTNSAPPAASWKYTE